MLIIDMPKKYLTDASGFVSCAMYDIQPTRDKAWTKRCRYNYCPSCGAKMDGAEDGKDL